MLKNAVRMRAASLIISLVVVMSIGCMGTAQAKGFFSSVLSALQPSTASTDGGTTDQVSGQTPYVFDVEGVGKVQGLGFQKYKIAVGVVSIETVSEIDRLPAKGVFKVIRIVVVNNGDETAIFPDSVLIDDAGQKYNPTRDIMTRLSNVHGNVLDVAQVGAGSTEEYFVAFDVPANANPKTLTLSILDLGSVKHELALPLTAVLQ